MDCAVKCDEAYFCSSIPGKPRNQTYGVQQDEISFLQAFFFFLKFKTTSTAPVVQCSYQVVSLTAIFQ